MVGPESIMFLRLLNIICGLMISNVAIQYWQIILPVDCHQVMNNLEQWLLEKH